MYSRLYEGLWCFCHPSQLQLLHSENTESHYSTETHNARMHVTTKRWKLIIQTDTDVITIKKMKLKIINRLSYSGWARKYPQTRAYVFDMKWENERRADLLCSAGGCGAQPSRPSSWSAWMISAHLHPQQGAYLALGDKINILTTLHT